MKKDLLRPSKWGLTLLLFSCFSLFGFNTAKAADFDELPVPTENLDLYKSYQYTPTKDGVLTIVYSPGMSDLQNILYSGYDGYSFSLKVEPLYQSSDYKEWQYQLEANKTYYLASQYCWGEYTAISITFSDEIVDPTPGPKQYFDELDVPLSQMLWLNNNYQYTPSEDGTLTLIYYYDMGEFGSLLYASYDDFMEKLENPVTPKFVSDDCKEYVYELKGNETYYLNGKVCYGEYALSQTSFTPGASTTPDTPNTPTTDNTFTVSVDGQTVTAPFKSFTITNSSNIIAAGPNFSSIKVFNSQGGIVAENASLSNNSITFNSDITAPGSYTLDFPEGAFLFGNDKVESVEKTVTFTIEASSTPTEKYFDELQFPAANLVLDKNYQYTSAKNGVLTVVYNMDISELGNPVYLGYDDGSGQFVDKVEPLFVSENNKEWQYELEAGKTYYFSWKYFAWYDYIAVSITFEDESGEPEPGPEPEEKYFDELPVPLNETLILNKSYQYTPTEDGTLTLVYNYGMSDLGNILYDSYNGSSFGTKVKPLSTSEDYKEWKYELIANKTYYLASQYCFGEYSLTSTSFVAGEITPTDNSFTVSVDGQTVTAPFKSFIINNTSEIVAKGQNFDNIHVLNSEGGIVTSAGSLSNNVVTLSSDIATPGTYKISFPAGAFLFGLDEVASAEKTVTVTIEASTPTGPIFDELPVPAENLVLSQNYEYTPTEDGILTITYNLNMSDLGNLLYAGYDEGSGTFNSAVDPIYKSVDYKVWQYMLEADKTYYLAGKYCFGEYSAVSITFGDETTGISNIFGNNDGVIKVYNLKGVNVINTTNASDLNNLSKGLYIINGKKVVIK